MEWGYSRLLAQENRCKTESIRIYKCNRGYLKESGRPLHLQLFKWLKNQLELSYPKLTYSKPNLILGGFNQEVSVKHTAHNS